MNVLADESVETQVVERLRADGHVVTYIAELAPSVSDDQVLDRANAESELLLTSDKDFGDLVYRLGRIHSGVVLTRLTGLAATVKADSVSQVFRDHATELAGAFTVVSPGAVRIRKRL
jgi:predicted nuclease of predicted toxin-antitoxin system